MKITDTASDPTIYHICNALENKIAMITEIIDISSRERLVLFTVFLLDLFKIKGKSAKNLAQREANLSIFKKKGFPNRREEEWKLQGP